MPAYAAPRAGARAARPPNGTYLVPQTKGRDAPKDAPGPQLLLLAFGHVRTAAVGVVLEPNAELVLLEHPSKDVVVATRKDEVAGDCETVTRQNP